MEEVNDSPIHNGSGAAAASVLAGNPINLSPEGGKEITVREVTRYASMGEKSEQDDQEWTIPKGSKLSRSRAKFSSPLLVS